MSKETKRKSGLAKICLGSMLVVGLSLACIPSAIAYSTEKTEAVELVSTQDAAPAEYAKTEVVYATLSAAGAVKGVYVVNQFDVSAAGVIEDFGAYSTVANLTDQGALKYADGATSFETGEGAFYYQGNAAVDAVKLPWNVALSYTLDGAAASPEDIAGKSGDLAVHVTTSRAAGVDPSFADSYMLQITFTLNGDTTTNIEAEGATIAQSGRDRTVAFTVLPGKNADCTLKAKVSDFEMAGVQIAALPYAMVMEMPDTSSMEGQMQELSDAISEMDSGMAELAAGSAEFSEGLSLAAQNAPLIIQSSKDIGSSLEALSHGISADNTQIASQINEVADQIDELAVILSQTEKKLQGSFEAWNEFLDNGRLSSDEQQALNALIAASASDQHGVSALKKLQDLYEAIYGGTYSDQSYSNFMRDLAALKLTAQQSSEGLSSISTLLRAIANAMTVPSADPNAQNLANATAGLSMLAKLYNDQFDAGLADFANGVSELNANYALINEGTQQFAGGLTQLNQATIKIPATMRAEIEKMMEDYDFPEFEPISFVDDRNDARMAAVQFVMTTEAIAVEEPEAEVEEEKGDEGIIDRFFALFQ